MSFPLLPSLMCVALYVSFEMVNGGGGDDVLVVVVGCKISFEKKKKKKLRI